MDKIPKINPFKTINSELDYKKVEEPQQVIKKNVKKINAQGRYLPIDEEMGSENVINDIRNEIDKDVDYNRYSENNTYTDDNLNQSFRFNALNNTYVISSHLAKLNMIKMRKKLMIMMILDIFSNLFYGFTFTPMFYSIPFISLSLYGVYKYQGLVLKIFQLYVISNIILKVYLSSLTMLTYQKILWLGFVPYDFYLLYKCWIFIWELSILNSYDRNELLKGWNSNHYSLSVL